MRGETKRFGLLSNRGACTGRVHRRGREAHTVVVACFDAASFAGCSKIIEQVTAAIADGATALTVDCTNMIDANATFAAALVVIARHVRDHSAVCVLKGLRGAPLAVVELHRLGPILAACGVVIEGFDTDPPAAAQAAARAA